MHEIYSTEEAAEEATSREKEFVGTAEDFVILQVRLPLAEAAQ